MMNKIKEKRTWKIPNNNELLKKINCLSPNMNDIKIAICTLIANDWSTRSWENYFHEEIKNLRLLKINF